MRFEHSPVAMIPLVPRLGKFPNFLSYTKPNTVSPPSFSRSLSLLAKLSRVGRNHGRRTRDKNLISTVLTRRTFEWKTSSWKKVNFRKERRDKISCKILKFDSSNLFLLNFVSNCIKFPIESLRNHIWIKSNYHRTYDNIYERILRRKIRVRNGWTGGRYS